MILNFANCDMVGHTGIMEAAIEAVETVDRLSGPGGRRPFRPGGAALYLR